MTKVIFGFQYINDYRKKFENQRFPSGAIQNQFLPEEQQQFYELHDLLWSRMAGKTQLQFGELHIGYNYVLGSSPTCYTKNAGIDEGHFTISHDSHQMTISSYHEHYMTNHYNMVVMVYNSYIVVEASSKKALEMLPIMLRLAL